MHCCEKEPIKNEPYDKNITAIATNGDIVYVGTIDNGLYKFDGETWTTPTPEGGIMLSETVTALVLSDNGGLWVGTGIGLFKFENCIWNLFLFSCRIFCLSIMPNFRRYNRHWS